MFVETLIDALVGILACVGLFRIGVDMFAGADVNVLGAAMTNSDVDLLVSLEEGLLSC